jgi:hypothetical protein
MAGWSRVLGGTSDRRVEADRRITITHADMFGGA